MIFSALDENETNREATGQYNMLVDIHSSDRIASGNVDMAAVRLTSAVDVLIFGLRNGNRRVEAKVDKASICHTWLILSIYYRKSRCRYRQSTMRSLAPVLFWIVQVQQDAGDGKVTSKVTSKVTALNDAA